MPSTERARSSGGTCQLSRRTRAVLPAGPGQLTLAGDGRWADTADRGEQAARLAAASCAAASCAMAAVTPILARGLQGAPGVRYDVLHTWDALVPPVYVVTGAALVWLRPRNALGWILAAGGTCGMAGTLLGVYGIRAHVVPQAGLPAGDVALSMAAWLWLPGLFLLPTLLPLLYPSGHLPSRRWRLAAAVCLAAGKRRSPSTDTQAGSRTVTTPKRLSSPAGGSTSSSCTRALTAGRCSTPGTPRST